MYYRVIQIDFIRRTRGVLFNTEKFLAFTTINLLILKWKLIFTNLQCLTYFCDLSSSSSYTSLVSCGGFKGARRPPLGLIFSNFIQKLLTNSFLCPPPLENPVSAPVSVTTSTNISNLLVIASTVFGNFGRV